MWWEKERKKVARDLRTSFMGTGKKGFAQLLKIGKYLQRIENDEQLHNHNDRCDMIEALIGEENWDILYDKLCDAVMELASKETE